jgi:hypothetical protein
MSDVAGAIASQLRLAASMLESTAAMVGDARFRDASGLYDGLREGQELISKAPGLAADMRDLAAKIERPSPMARKWAASQPQRENTP